MGGWELKRVFPEQTDRTADDDALAFARHCVMQAQQLMLTSDALRQRALNKGGPGLQLGAQIAETIGLLKAQLGLENDIVELDQAMLTRLIAVLGKARVAAREAASSAVEIRTLIGAAPLPLHQYLGLPASNVTSLHSLEQQLQQLHADVARTSTDGGAQMDELAIIASRLEAMHRLACHNTAAAVAAALVAEKLHLQAAQFIQGVQRAILF